MAFRWLSFEFYSTEIWQINTELIGFKGISTSYICLSSLKSGPLKWPKQDIKNVTLYRNSPDSQSETSVHRTEYAKLVTTSSSIAENFLWYFNLIESDFKRQFWNRERFVIKYLEIFFLTLAAKWAAMIHSKYLKPFLLQFQYLNWNEYLECILDASNQKSSSFTPWSTFRLNWRPLIGSSQFREFNTYSYQ